MTTPPIIPNLTNCCPRLNCLHEHFVAHQNKIEEWFTAQWQVTPAPITASVDIRHAGYKIAPVDTNLFPAGYNNLDRELLSLASKHAKTFLKQYYPACTRLLLIAENHTQHPFYYQSLAVLQNILIQAGYEVRIGSMLPQLTQATAMAINPSETLWLEPLHRSGNRIQLADYDPCLIILNNDLSGGIPAILTNLEQAITPPLNMGWSARLKSTHFKHFTDISNEFAKLLAIDPWLIQPLFSTCDQIDFIERSNEHCLREQTQALLQAIQRKYQEYDISHQPFVVIKADQGTYGLGILMVKDASEITQLNRKQRQKMTTIKGRQKLDRVIIQEGIYTTETIGPEKAVAEPVGYLIGGQLVGGFYRVHTDKQHDENLNAPGMYFTPLAFPQKCISQLPQHLPEETNSRFYAYCIISRLAALAAGRELLNLTTEKIDEH